MMTMAEIAASGRSRMRLIVIAAALLASCGSDTATSTEAEVAQTGPQRAVLDAHTVGDPTRPQVVGVTNLPDGTILMVSLSREEIGFAAGSKAFVSGGHFNHPAFTKDGGPLPPGNYSLSVGTPNADLQPPSVRQAVGKDYSNYTGSLVTDPYGFGPSVDFEGTHKVPGKMSAKELKAEQQRRLAEMEEWARTSCADIQTPSIRKDCLEGIRKSTREIMGID